MEEAAKQIPVAMQYGALGVLTLFLGAVLFGFFWYVRSVEQRAAEREKAEAERLKQWIDAYVKGTAALTTMSAELQSHDKRMQEEHEGILRGCQQFNQRGIGERRV